jgi:hypothetical protein
MAVYITYGSKSVDTTLRQGHDSLTSMRHYQGLAFSEDDIKDIKKQLSEWGILRK